MNIKLLKMNAQNIKLSIRVYGLISENEHILISYENWYDRSFFKFPGGGLEPGESPIQTLHREFKEEMSIEIKDAELIHIPHKVIFSIFYPNTQVIPIYYRVKVQKYKDFPLLRKEIQLPKLKHSEFVFFWVPFQDVENLLSFESDKDSWFIFLKKYHQ
ncbi:MAG: NUDIX domain-containing protein [Bacteroidales bacterium]|nr:NUDIX domain-containing protein [Bacteroidales bacterium]